MQNIERKILQSMVFLMRIVEEIFVSKKRSYNGCLLVGSFQRSLTMTLLGQSTLAKKYFWVDFIVCIRLICWVMMDGWTYSISLALRSLWHRKLVPSFFRLWLKSGAIYYWIMFRSGFHIYINVEMPYWQSSVNYLL